MMASLFKNNAGKLDRIIRVIVGALLVGNVFTGLQTPLGWIGLILTGLSAPAPSIRSWASTPKPSARRSA